jgi:hypothetical protein
VQLTLLAERAPELGRLEQEQRARGRREIELLLDLGDLERGHAIALAGEQLAQARQELGTARVERACLLEAAQRGARRCELILEHAAEPQQLLGARSGIGQRGQAHLVGAGQVYPALSGAQLLLELFEHGLGRRTRGELSKELVDPSIARVGR